jgi:sRNA-binding carbon storage regulator CsrA
VIGDGQRITVLTIAQQELAFVIGAPELVGKFA